MIAPSAPPRRRRLARPETAVLLGAAALIAYLALVPVGYLVWGAFFDDDGLTLEHFRRAFRGYGLSELVVNSLWFALGSTAVAMTAGTLSAFLVMRTDVGFRRFAFAAALVPLIVPGVLYTIAWIFLASPRIGALNQLPGPTFDIFSPVGMVLVEGLHLAPLVFLLMAAAFRSLDPALEEAAVASGAGRLTVLRRVTLPLLRPALLAGALITIVRAIESFEVPALLGIPGGTWVLTSRIWQAFERVPPDIGAAGAYSFSLLVVTAVGVLAYTRLTGGERRFETIAGRGHRPVRIELGRWRAPLTAALLAYLTVASLLPLLLLAYGSLQPVYSKFALDGLNDLTLRHYSDALTDDGARNAFGNSLVLGVGTATAVMLVTAIVAWMVVRSRVRGRWLLDALASLPLVVPGLVLGVALLFVWLRSPLPVYGTLWILAIAYFTRFMPHGIRFSTASMHQIGGELEEAARTSGASWWGSFRRVVLPLALPGLAAGWIYVFILSMRELSATILLYSPGTETVSILIWNAYNDSLLAGMAATGMLLVLVLAVLAAVAYLLFTRAQRTLDAHN